MKKVGEIIAKILWGIILFIKYVVIGNFRGFLAMIGLALMFIGFLGMLITWDFSFLLIWGVGALLIFIIWLTGPIKITFTVHKEK